MRYRPALFAALAPLLLLSARLPAAGEPSPVPAAPPASAGSAPVHVPVAGEPPTVTRGREAGEPFGPGLPDPDHAAERRSFLAKRVMTGQDRIPRGAFEAAARDFVRRREETMARHEQDLARIARGGAPQAVSSLPSGPWSQIGPAPIAPLSGMPFGAIAGRISTVALHPGNANILLAGSSHGGIWRTTDNGVNWTPVGDALPSLNIADIQFAPSNPAIVYAASGDDDMWQLPRGAGMMKSTDGGVTWARIDNGSAANGIPDGTVLSRLVIDPANPAKVVVASYGAQLPDNSYPWSSIFRTTDGGVTWMRSTLPTAGGNGGSRSLAIEANCPLNLWAVENRTNRLIRSTDGGVTWAATAAAGLPAFTDNSQIAVSHASCSGSATVYISVYSDDGGLAGSTSYPGFYRSLDGGANFSRPGPPGPSGGCLYQCWMDHNLLADPGNANYIYMIGRDLWMSSDGGATWVNRSGGFDDGNGYHYGGMHVDMHDLKLRGSGASATLYVGSDGGLWSYDIAGNSFTNRVGNLAVSEFIDLAIRPDAPNQALGGTQDNGSVAWTGSAVWPTRAGGDGGASGWMRYPAQGPYNGAFVTYIQNTAYRSSDSGVNFYNWAVPFWQERVAFYAPWIYTPGHNRVWHGGKNLYYVDYPTGAWTRMGDIEPFGPGTTILELAVHDVSAAAPPGPYYAGVDYQNFWYSPDGVAWTQRGGGLPSRSITSINLNPANPQQVWVTVSGFGTGHVFMSGDGGQTFTDKSGNLPNVPVNTLLPDPQLPQTWYVGTDAGLFATENGGSTWTAVGNNFPAVQVSDLELDASHYLYAATGGRSVWRISLNTCTAPGTPTAGAAATPANNQISVSWTGGSPAAARYNVYRAVGTCASPGPFAKVGSQLAGSPFLDTTVSGGTPYAYQTAGTDATGWCESAQSGCVQATATGPCRLTPVFAGATGAASADTAACGVSVNWTAGASSCGGGLTYSVYRGTAPDFIPAPANLAASGVSGTTYADATGLLNGTAYYYIVRAVDASGNSDANLTARLAVPNGPAAAHTYNETFEAGGGVPVNNGWIVDNFAHFAMKPWIGATDAPHSGSGHRYDADDPSYSDHALESPPLTIAADSVLSFWHAWSFDNGWDVQTASFNCGDYCQDGGILEYRAGTGAWTPIPGDQITGATYNNVVGTVSDIPFASRGSRVAAWAGGDGGPLPAYQQAFVNLGAIAGAGPVQVRWHQGDDSWTMDNAGTGEAHKGWYLDDIMVTNVANTPSPCGVTCSAPGAPLAPAVTAPADNRLSVSWGNGSPASAKYNIYRAVGSCAAPGPFIQMSQSGGGPYLDTTVSGGVTYAYRITGTDASGWCESAQSPCVAATATGSCTQRPTFTGLASAASAGSATCGINLAWNGGTSNCAGPLTYRIYRSTVPGFIPSAANQIASGVTATAYLDTATLSGGTAYYYLVRAEDSRGNLDANTAYRVAVANGPPAAGTFLETYEAGNGEPVNNGWSVDNLIAGAPAPWTGSTARAHGGTGSRFDPDYPGTSDHAWESPPLTIASGSVLSFWHTWSFDNNLDDGSLNPSYNCTWCWDGGVLEYRKGTGAWTRITAAQIAGSSYNKTISSSGSNPLGAVPAWAGGTGTAGLPAFAQATVNIGAIAGAGSVQLRWRQGNNMYNYSNGGAVGWCLDDIQVTGVANAPTACTTLCAATPINELRAVKSGVDLVLNWPVASGAASYRVYRKPSPGAAWPAPLASGLATPGWSDAGQLSTAGSQFYSATNLNGCGAESSR